MKKLFTKTTKILSTVLIMMAVLLVGATVNAATAPNSITVKRAEVLSDLVTNHPYGFTIFETQDGKTIYCMDIQKKPLRTGDTATLVGDADAGLLYILMNGYPNKTISKNVPADKYITQAAIWWYLDETGQGGKMSKEFKEATLATDTYGLIPDYIKPMVANAKKAKDTQAKPSIKTTISGTDMKLTSDGKYYETGYIYATLVNAPTYTVSVSGAKNVEIIGEDGKAKTTFNSNAKFKVRVPASEVTSKTDIKINFNATGSVKKAKIYKPSDSTFQRVVGLYDEETKLTDSVTVTATPKLSCDYKDGKYYDKDGKETDKKTFDKQCGPKCEHKDGKYYGKDGDEVNKKTFDKECGPKCQIKDGKHYGKDGNEVDKKTYDKECGPKCEIKNGKYYGKDGNEVNRTTYDKECGQIVFVPNTLDNISLIAVGLGILVIGASTALIIHRRNKNLNLSE